MPTSKHPERKPNLERVPFFHLGQHQLGATSRPLFWVDFTKRVEFKKKALGPNMKGGSTGVEFVLAYDHTATATPMILKYGNPDWIIAEAKVQKTVHDIEQIPTVHGVGVISHPETKQDEIAMLMQYVPGRKADIFSDFDRETLLNPEVMGLFAQTLAYVHAHNFAHADFVNNILLSPDKKNGPQAVKPYLIDFDSSTYVQQTARMKYSYEKRITTGLRGTDRYVAPEQFLYPIDAGNLTPDSDLYILALMMYTLFTGETLLETVRDTDYRKKTVYTVKHQETLMQELPTLIDRDFYKNNSKQIDKSLYTLFTSTLQVHPKNRSPKRKNVEKIPYFVQELYLTTGLWCP